METIYKNGKKIGSLNKGIYYTYRDKDTFFKTYQGFGISENILTELKEAGCYHVCICYTGTDFKVTKYNCPLTWFLHSTKTYNDYGDLQRFVSLSEFKKALEVNKENE